jgi:four helix bundle protein
MPSNIAEGFSRHSTPHYIQHLWTAHRSGAELETQFVLAQD